MHRFLAALLLLVLASCSSEQVPVLDESLSALLNTPEYHVARIGIGMDHDEHALLSRPISARILRGGEAIAVLDDQPPFLKIYDRHGRLLHSAFPRGGGPGEAERLYSLAVLGDSLLLAVEASGRLVRAGIDGRYLAEQRIEEIALYAMVEGCSDELIIYGPRRGATHETAWLHALHFDATGRVEIRPLYSDTLAPTSYAFGRAYGLVRTATGVEARHATGAASQLLRYACETSTTAAQVVQGTAVYPDRLPATNESATAFAIAEGMRIPSGAAQVVDISLLADAVGSMDSIQETRTLLHIAQGESSRSVLVRGAYMILDSRPGVGVLFSTPDPVPHLILVREPDLVQRLRAGQR
jgi:hypothetical protein